MNSNNLYYQEYLRQIAEEQARQNQAGSPYSNLKGYASNIGSYGNNLSLIGNTIKNNVDNAVAQKFGSGMANVGNTLSNGANAVNNTLNAPQNYFKGVAKNTLGNAASKAGQYLATKTGLAGTIGAGLSNLGAGLTGTAAGTAAGAGAGAAAGTAAGTAAGASAAGAGAGAAASGAAAGGSAASGAAAAGPIGALVGLGIMALQGSNRKRAKQSGQALLNQTNQIVNQESEAALNQAQQNTAALQQQSENALANGIMTGGAAPMQSEQQYDPIAEYQDYLRQSGYSDDVINGVPQGLNSGNKDIADWIAQYNQGAAGQKNPINVPQTPEEIAAAQAGTFNNPVQMGGVNQTQSVKDTLLSKFANGLSDFAKGYQENKTTAFAPENLQANNSKGKMTRAGEALGTIARISQNPTVQGLIAGGLSTALTGNPLYGLGQGYKFANNRQMSNIYQKALQDQGVNVDTGMFGNVGNADFNSLMTPQYKQWENELKKIYYDTLADYRAGMLKNAEKKTEIDANYKQNKLEIDRKNAQSNAIRANKVGSGRSSSKTPKPQDNPEWASDLSDFSRIITDPRFVSKSDEAKARFIKKYGVDPMKYIKL